MTTLTPPAARRAAGRATRVRTQAWFELGSIVRNGEQLMVTLLLPALLLVVLSVSDVVTLDTGGRARIDHVTPGVLALAVMSAALTSQAISTSFDRRNGVLRLMATTPLGPGGLLAGKAVALLCVEAVQVTVLGAVAAVLGWRPDPAGLALALVVLVLGTMAFTALAMLVAGTLRFEAVLALANILLVLLAVGGGVVVPADSLPDALAAVARLLPSGALGEGLRGALHDGAVAWRDVAVLLGWSGALGWATVRTFRWS